ncbi:MAG: hypothetical protein SNJ49_12200 [Chloracidobacterium sp.]
MVTKDGSFCIKGNNGKVLSFGNGIQVKDEQTGKVLSGLEVGLGGNHAELVAQLGDATVTLEQTTNGKTITETMTVKKTITKPVQRSAKAPQLSKP